MMMSAASHRLRHLSQFILVVILLSDIWISLAAAIKCFNCLKCPPFPKVLNLNDTHQFDKKYEYDCNREDIHGGSSVFCSKVVRPDGFVDRMCATKNTVQQAYDFGHKCDEFMIGKTKVLNKICFCQTDFCNGAPAFGVRMVMMRMVILLLSLMLPGFLIRA